MPKILKVKFDNISGREALQKILEWAKSDKQRQIVTPNPEIVLEAQKNHKFLTLLNQSALSIPDGIGILWAAKYLKITEKDQSKVIKTAKWIFSLSTTLLYPKYIRTELKERVTGTDLMQQICATTDQKVFLLGAEPGVAKKAKHKLEKKYPHLKIVGTHAGTPGSSEEKEIRQKIIKSEAKILFVAFGAPKQEFWIQRNLKQLPNIKVAIGIGGAFDFIAGTRRRAAKWIQKLSLEWLFRILQQPRRIKRIWNATIKFPIKVLKSR